MKLWRLLTLPGHAFSETVRAVWLVVFALAVAFAVMDSFWTHDATLRWTLHAGHIWTALNAVVWVWLSNTVLLARDARALRLPTLERQALASVGLYGFLSVVVPGLALGWAGGHWLTVMIMLLFGAGVGVAYALLPVYLAVVAIFAARLPGALSSWLPQAMQPGFDGWAGPLVVLFWLMLGWRTRGLILGGHSLQAPHGPMVMVFRRGGLGWGSGGTAERWGRRSPGHGPLWARPKVDLRGCGPGRTERSPRAALGGWWMPQTALSRLGQCVLLLLALLVGAMILLLQATADRHDLAATLAGALRGAGNVAFFGALLTASLAFGTIRLLVRRWDRTSAELSLLALLPGLGDAPTVKRTLLRASLLPTVGMQCGLGLLLLALGAAMHLGAEDEALLLLGPLGSSVLLCVFALVIFGATPRRGWGMELLMAAGCLWICVSAGIVQANAHPGVSLGEIALLVLAIGWSAFFVALLWLGCLGWRGLQRRPHPFLVN